jgi:hypothetical protein
MLPATDPTTAEPAKAGTTATNPRRIRHSDKRTMQCLLTIIYSPSLGRVANYLPNPTWFQNFFDFGN